MSRRYRLEPAVNGVPEETGANRMRRIVGLANMTNEGALDGYLVVEILRIFAACWASGWDILPDELKVSERDYAAEHGVLSKSAARRLDRAFGGKS